jgi:signal transduction histidine kinase
MNDIRQMIYKMEDEERNLLKQRKEKLRSVSISIKIITLTSLIIAILLTFYSFITYSREMHAKIRADKQATLYGEQLEAKVKELQDANTELQELRSLEKFTATGRIARTIAHEIRNPLTNIGLATDQIKTSVEQNEDTMMLIDMVNRNANRINQMISELLTSTKFGILQYAETSLNNLLDDTVELARDRLDLKQVEVVKHYSADCRVMVDIDKMKIAFLNIFVNAIEAMETGKGILKIETKAVDDKCVIDISDNGSGINEETLQKIFEPYFTDKSKGAGLGLTHTQNIILNHKGSIQASSEMGVGTTFTITLNTL